jgi:prepilin-type N-terminal cleavage/methylation domain-containing protein
MRRGFTVVEVLVALVVVTVGLLGVAGASAVALRASSAALRERSAVTRARTRLALLEAAGCATAASGEMQLAAGVVDRWTVEEATNGVRLVEVRAEWNDSSRRKHVLVRSALLC